MRRHGTHDAWLQGTHRSIANVVAGTMLVAAGLGVGALAVTPEASALGARRSATYVALGDSYAAGEGLGVYEPGTNVKKGAQRNQCHRSLNAYATLTPLAVLPTVHDRAFWACAGATSRDMMRVPPQSGPQTQYKQPRQTDTVGAATKWISISAGGNDLKFGAVGLACAVAVIDETNVLRVPGQKPCALEVDRARRLRQKTEATLVDLYKKLLADAPSAVLAIVGYPRVFPKRYSGLPTFNGAKFCVTNHYSIRAGALRKTVDVGVWKADAQNLDRFTVDINDTIRNAIVDVRMQNPDHADRIRYVDTYSTSIPRNCRGTTPGATVNGLQLSPRFRGIGPLKKSWISSATFHPTKGGQQMFARRVQAAFNRLSYTGDPTTMSGTVGASFFGAAVVTGGRAPLAVTTGVGGAVPPWASLGISGHTIVLSGTPETAGSWMFTIVVSDAGGDRISIPVTVVVSTEVASDWPQFRRDTSHTGANPAEAIISPATADRLDRWWSRPASGWVRSSPAVVNGVVYAASEGDHSVGGDVFAVDARTGSDIWARRFDVMIESSPAVSNGRVFLGTGVDFQEGSLVALDARTGDTIWAQPLTYSPNFSSPIVSDGIVYIGSRDTGGAHGIVWAFDEATGGFRWSKDLEGQILGSPVVANGIVFVGNGVSMFALDAQTGSEIWMNSIGGTNGAPSIVDGTLYFGSPRAGGLVALDAASGRFMWRHFVDGYIDLSSPAVVDGVAYIGTTSGKVYAIDVVSQSLRWSQSLPGNIESSPAVAGGVVFIGDSDGRIYALDASSGSKLWSNLTSPDSLIDSSPAVSNGSVYVGSSDGRLHAYSRQQGL